MRWFLAGLVFAAVVGLGIATAAIEADNIRRRQRMQRVADRLEAAHVSLIAERLRFRDATRLPRLVRRWLELQARLDQESGT